MNFTDYITESKDNVRVESISHDVVGNGFVQYDITYKSGPATLYVISNIDFVEYTDNEVIAHKNNVEVAALNLDKNTKALISLYTEESSVMDDAPKVSKDFINRIFAEIVKYNKSNAKEIIDQLKKAD